MLEGGKGIRPSGKGRMRLLGGFLRHEAAQNGTLKGKKTAKKRKNLGARYLEKPLDWSRFLSSFFSISSVFVGGVMAPKKCWIKLGLLASSFWESVTSVDSFEGVIRERAIVTKTLTAERGRRTKRNLLYVKGLAFRVLFSNLLSASLIEPSSITKAFRIYYLDYHWQ